MRIGSDGAVVITNPGAAALYVGSANTSTQECAVQIGNGRTSNGSSFMDLVGDTTYWDYGLRVLRNGTSSGSSQIVHRGTGNFDIFGMEACNMNFYTNSAERMRITSGGDVLIGTNTTAGIAGTRQYMSKAGGTTWQHGPATDGSGNTFWILNGSNTGVGLVSGTTAWSSSSDERLKKNIHDLNYGLAEIKNLRPVRFDYLNDESNESKRIGFIAQEVLPLVPESVSGSEDSFYSLASTELIPVLVAALKELSAKVEQLEARLPQN